MTTAVELTPSELMELDGFLALKDGGYIHNAEALDGFLAALACCPDLVMPSEYMPVIVSGETEDGDLAFESMEEAEWFMTLVHLHWNYVNHQLNECPAYMPLLLENDGGGYGGNDWANGFICGVDMRPGIRSEVIDSEEHGGSMVAILALAFEHHPDPELRPFEKPLGDRERDDLIVGAAAGVMWMHAYWLGRRDAYAARTGTFVRAHRKAGRNEPCPCGSGNKYRRCCGKAPTLH